MLVISPLRLLACQRQGFTAAAEVIQVLLLLRLAEVVARCRVRRC